MTEYPKKPPLESEDHHWWPKCVSKHWKNDQGFIQRMSSTGIDDPYKKTKNLALFQMLIQSNSQINQQHGMNLMRIILIL